MSQKFNAQEGAQVAQWTLRTKLGRGGNGEVWKADGENGEVVALKIGFYQDATHVRYRRFKSEVEILRRLGVVQGILPYLDASLPDKPTAINPAWLAMPIATPLGDAIGSEAPLEVVVGAVAAIAHTLARLAEQGISHRDIKPGNLYQYQDQWAIGDFGLAHYPDKEALTQTGERLGPANFFAPEMLEAKGEDGAPADVFSLAKTLWVLGADQKFPPPGEIRIDRPAMCLSAYVKHERVRQLDRLIERATTYSPQDRVSMSDFAKELSSWQRTRSIAPSSPDDLSDLAIQLGQIIENIGEPIRLAQERHENVIAQFQEIRRTLSNGIDQIQQRLSLIFPDVSSVGSDVMAPPMFTCPSAMRPSGQEQYLLRGKYYVHTHSPNGKVAFRSAIEFELFDYGQLYIVGGHAVTVPVNTSTIPYPGEDFKNTRYRVAIEWSISEVVPMGSAQQDEFIEEVAQFLHENLRPSIEAYAKFLREGT